LEVGLDVYLEIRGGSCGKVDSFGGTGAFIEGNLVLIGENNVRAIGAISAVKPNELWAQSVGIENFLGHEVTFWFFAAHILHAAVLAFFQLRVGDRYMRGLSA